MMKEKSNSVSYNNLDTCRAYKGLIDLYGKGSAVTAPNPERFRSLSCPAGGGLTYYYGPKLLSDGGLEALDSLAKEQQLIEKYNLLASGEIMNTGEKRMVLHHLLRGEPAGPVVKDGTDYGAFYRQQLEGIAEFSDAVHSGSITGSTGKPFDTVVQIGIGGSDLGPRALYLALETLADTEGFRRMRARFISNVDPDDAARVLRTIDPETTLFILVSKSGTTQETLANRRIVIEHLEKSNRAVDPSKHFIAVTSQTSPLASSGDVLASFFIDDFIGGRFSATSAVGGVVLSLAYGPDTFKALLQGAAEADRLALKPDMRENAALTDAMIGIYERTVARYPCTAVLPYSQALLRFPAHLQQLDMESNGKSVNRFGTPVNYPTGPVVFGEPGTNGQHSFYQLLHQGTDPLPLQFIGFKESQAVFEPDSTGRDNQIKLLANLAAQITAFTRGKASDEGNKHFPGGRPASLLFAERLTPETLGALLAHYENKVMFQGFCWNLNSFDQEGVQLGKVLAKDILSSNAEDGLLKTLAEIVGLESTPPPPAAGY